MSRRVLVFLMSIAIPASLLAAPSVARSDDVELFTRLSGAQEIPGPGDPDGYGKAWFWIEGGQLCADLSWRGIGAPHAGHIHRGVRGEAGPVVVALFLTQQAGRGLEGCDPDADPSTVVDIFNHPSNYYVNYHNEAYPNGAIRGQLRAT